MASEMMWRKLSEGDKKAIQDKAKKIMLEFGKSIEKLPEMPDSFVERAEFERAEGSEDGGRSDNDFRKIMFENAPKKDKDSIIAEKGKWV